VRASDKTRHKEAAGFPVQPHRLHPWRQSARRSASAASGSHHEVSTNGGDVRAVLSSRPGTDRVCADQRERQMPSTRSLVNGQRAYRRDAGLFFRCAAWGVKKGDVRYYLSLSLASPLQGEVRHSKDLPPPSRRMSCIRLLPAAGETIEGTAQAKPRDALDLSAGSPSITDLAPPCARPAAAFFKIIDAMLVRRWLRPARLGGAERLVPVKLTTVG
jgi:hypothetical protein